MGAPRNVGKGLVDGNPLDEWREIIEHLDGGIAQPLVLLEMAADKDQLRTELARPPSRHAAADPEGPGFVRSGKHDPPADGDRLAAQRWVEQLLDRGIESIQVRMEDGGCRFHHNQSPTNIPAADYNCLDRLRTNRSGGARFGRRRTLQCIHVRTPAAPYENKQGT